MKENRLPIKREEYDIDIIPRFMGFIDKHYTPATVKDAKIFVSTEEICNKVCNHLGLEVHPIVFYGFLEELGFKYTEMNDAGYMWLMNYKEGTTPAG
jgi:hypothetical protein